MSLDALLIACEDLQAGVQDVWASSDPLQKTDPITFYEFLLSPENTEGVAQAIAPGNGKVRTVNVQWEQRLSEDIVSMQYGRDCDATNKNKMFEQDYTIDTELVAKVDQVILTKDLRHLCENDDMYIQRQITKMLDVMDRKVASKTATEAKALVGQYSADTISAYTMTGNEDTLKIKTKNTNGDFVGGGWEKIDMAATMSGFNQFIGFGNVSFSEFARYTQAGCCTSFGLDIGELYSRYGKAFAYDRRLAAALSTDADALFTEFGALQLLTYTANEALENLNFRFGFEAFTMVTPRGLPVDVLIKVDCPGEIHINMYSATKLIAKPDDLFADGDNFRLTKGTGFVKIDNA